MKVIIRAVRKRSHFVSKMKEQFGDAIVYYDDFYHDAMKSFLHVLAMNGDDPVIITEDDIELTSNFLSKAQAVIDQHPNEVIQFFSMRKDDLTIGSRYDNNYLMGQCTYFPKGFTKALRNYYDVWKHTKRGVSAPNGTDTMVCDFLKARREKYWIEVPSLVQHIEAKSIIDSRRSSKRQSKTFVK